MNKTKDTGYLFAKMSSAEENGVGHIIVTEQKDSKTYHFDEKGKASEKQSMKKWLLDNVMLLVTLTGVLVGIVTGMFIIHLRVFTVICRLIKNSRQKRRRNWREFPQMQFQFYSAVTPHLSHCESGKQLNNFNARRVGVFCMKRCETVFWVGKNSEISFQQSF